MANAVLLSFIVLCFAAIEGQLNFPEQATSTTETTSTSITRSRSSTTSRTCGVAGRLHKIVGGTDVSSENVYFSWFVALAKPDKKNGEPYIVACGATLITPKHVVTAAHCYGERSPLPMKDRLLAVFELVNRCTDKGRIEKIANVIIHNKYRPTNQIPDYDIAMIYLANEVSNIPICPPSKSSFANEKGIIIGYGSTKVRSLYPCQMLIAQVDIYTKERCKNSGIGIEIARKTICAGITEGGVDACDGDSGGPLMIKNKEGKYELIGVVSYGEGCGRVNTPGLYTDVTDAGYLQWIRERIGSRQGSSSSSSSSHHPSHGRPPSSQKPRPQLTSSPSALANNPFYTGGPGAAMLAWINLMNQLNAQ